MRGLATAMLSGTVAVMACKARPSEAPGTGQTKNAEPERGAELPSDSEAFELDDPDFLTIDEAALLSERAEPADGSTINTSESIVVGPFSAACRPAPAAIPQVRVGTGTTQAQAEWMIVQRSIRKHAESFEVCKTVPRQPGEDRCESKNTDVQLVIGADGSASVTQASTGPADAHLDCVLEALATVPFPRRSSVLRLNFVLGRR